MNNLNKVIFVGGPRDGEGEVHSLANALHLTIPGHPEGYYSINPYHMDGKFYWILKTNEESQIKMDPLAKAKARQRKAAAHGRRTKLERCLNALGLSLFAPPFGSKDECRFVQFNEWEGWTPTTDQLEIFRLISAVGTAINNIERAATNQSVRDQCARAMEELAKLGRYCQECIKSNE